jgi:hypothetical protein
MLKLFYSACVPFRNFLNPSTPPFLVPQFTAEQKPCQKAAQEIPVPPGKSFFNPPIPPYKISQASLYLTRGSPAPTK